MADVAVLTAIYDGYDTLKPAMPQDGVNAEWVCVTDDEILASRGVAYGWTVRYVGRPGLHPNRAAKFPKYRPWLYTGAPASVWVDASFRVVSSRFVVEAMAYPTPVAQFEHPWRDCVYTEADASADLVKYQGEPVRDQADHYRQQGHPAHWGLWATGVIARWHTNQVRDFGDAWMAETDAWSFQDQISEPYALRQCGLRPASFPGTHLQNAWLSYEGSGRH